MPESKSTWYGQHWELQPWHQVSQQPGQSYIKAIIHFYVPHVFSAFKSEMYGMYIESVLNYQLGLNSNGPHRMWRVPFQYNNRFESRDNLNSIAGASWIVTEFRPNQEHIAHKHCNLTGPGAKQVTIQPQCQISNITNSNRNHFGLIFLLQIIMLYSAMTMEIIYFYVACMVCVTPKREYGLRGNKSGRMTVVVSEGTSLRLPLEDSPQARSPPPPQLHHATLNNNS